MLLSYDQCMQIMHFHTTLTFCLLEGSKDMSFIDSSALKLCISWNNCMLGGLAYVKSLYVILTKVSDVKVQQRTKE